MQKPKINITGYMSPDDMKYVLEKYGKEGLDDLLIQRAKYKLTGVEKDEWNCSRHIK